MSVVEFGASYAAGGEADCCISVDSAGCAWV